MKQALKLLILLFFVSSVFADDWVVLQDQDRYKLSQRLKYLEDPSSELTIQQILNIPSNDWISSNSINTSFGYSESAYWFHLSFDVQHSALWYLWLRYAPHDDVKFYWVKDGKIVDFTQSGDRYPFNTRTVNIADNAVARQLYTGEKVKAYFRIKTQGSYRVPIEIRQRSSFEQEHTTVTAFQGTYYGVLIVMTIFNLVLFFITKIRSYLFYVMYVFTSLGSRLGIDGTGFQFLWPNYPVVNEWLVPVSFWSSGIAFLIFSYTFLNVSKATPVIRMYFWFLGVLGGLLGIGVFTLSYQQVVPLTTLYAMLLMFSSLISATVMTFWGHKYAGVFAIATIMTALSFAFTVMDSLGFFSDQTLMIYSYPTARIFEIVLFAIALGVRIRFLQNRRLEAEKEAIENREQAIRNIEQYKRLYDSAIIGNFILNLDGQIQSGNKAFYELVKYDENQYQSLNKYLINEDTNLLEKIDGGKEFSRHLDCEAKNGKWLSLYLNKVMDDKVGFIEGSLIDISDRKHAENIKKQAEQDKMQAMQQLVVGVAHEMNTPLGVVRTGSDFACDTLAKIERGVESVSLSKSEFLSLINSSSEALKLADQNIERMADLIKSFKEVSVEQMQFSADRLELDPLIERLKDDAHEMNLNLHCQIESTLNSAFITFPDAIYWVLFELFNNSKDHSDSDEVYLQLKINDAKLSIEYRDKGKGVSSEYLNHIFEPFFTTKRGSEKKLGLGLYQVHNIVTQLLKSDLNIVNKDGLMFEMNISNLNDMHTSASHKS